MARQTEGDDVTVAKPENGLSENVAEPNRGKAILVVDDEAAMLRALKAVLGQRGYEVILAASGEEALQRAPEANPDLVILDLTLPGISGLEVCRSLREWLKVPILVLSVRSGETDKIAALDLGADDYLTKPFSTGELLARIRALLRRTGPEQSPPTVIHSGGLSIDLDRKHVSRGGHKIKLTRTEFALLSKLAENADRVVTSAMLVRYVWGPGNVEGTMALRAHMSHLRSKIEPESSAPRYVVTEPGVGYRFVTFDDGE